MRCHGSVVFVSGLALLFAGLWLLATAKPSAATRPAFEAISQRTNLNAFPTTAPASSSPILFGDNRKPDTNGSAMTAHVEVDQAVGDLDAVREHGAGIGVRDVSVVSAASLIAELRSIHQGTVLSTHATTLLEELGKSDPDIARKLVKRDESVQYQHLVVLCLKKLNNSKAKSELLSLAMSSGEGGYSIGREAVAALAALSDGTGELTSVLEKADHVFVREVAASLMGGRALDDNAVRALAAFPQKDGWKYYSGVANTFRADSSERWTALKVGELLKAADMLSKGVEDTAADPETGFTTRQSVLTAIFYSLSEMKGAESVLRKEVAGRSGASREMAALALAKRGVSDTHAIVVKTVEGSEDIMRLLGIYGLEGIAKASDIPLLEKLAQADPFMISVPHRPLKGEARFPIRLAAKNVLQKLK